MYMFCRNCSLILHTLCTYSPHVLLMFCTCYAHVLHMLCSCFAHVMQRFCKLSHEQYLYVSITTMYASTLLCPQSQVIKLLMCIASNTLSYMYTLGRNCTYGFENFISEDGNNLLTLFYYTMVMIAISFIL